MRRLILALMIILLPVRGWMVDAMAVEPATGMATAMASLAGSVPATVGAAHFDAGSNPVMTPGGHGNCAEHAATDASASGPMQGDLAGIADSADSDHAAHGSGCTVCQMCHTVAMSVDAPLLPAMPRPALAPATSLPRFTSAVPAPGLKPPIS